MIVRNGYMLKDLQNRKYRESLVTMYVQVLLSNNTVHCGYIVNPRREDTSQIPIVDTVKWKK